MIACLFLHSRSFCSGGNNSCFSKASEKYLFQRAVKWSLAPGRVNRNRIVSGSYPGTLGPTRGSYHSYPGTLGSISYLPRWRASAALAVNSTFGGKAAGCRLLVEAGAVNKQRRWSWRPAAGPARQPFDLRTILRSNHLSTHCSKMLQAGHSLTQK